MSLTGMDSLTAGFSTGLKSGLDRQAQLQDHKNKMLEQVAQQDAEQGRQMAMLKANEEYKNRTTLRGYTKDKLPVTNEMMFNLPPGATPPQLAFTASGQTFGGKPASPSTAVTMKRGSDDWNKALDLAMTTGPAAVMGRMPPEIKLEFAADMARRGYNVDLLAQQRLGKDVNTNKQLISYTVADHNLDGLQKAVEAVDFTGTNIGNKLSYAVGEAMGTPAQAVESAYRAGNIDELALVFQRGGVPTDAARGLASAILSSKTSKGIEAQIKIARTFIRNQQNALLEGMGRPKKEEGSTDILERLKKIRQQSLGK